MKTRTTKNPNLAGFTLIEVMITVAVVAILAAVAVPQYFDYVTRSRLVEAKTNLVDMRTRLEQFFLDNRTYPTSCIAAGVAPSAVQINLPANAKFFTVTCGNLSATTYRVTATGTGSMSLFVFTVDEANTRRTMGVKSGWTLPSPDTCWISRKNGDC